MLQDAAVTRLIVDWPRAGLLVRDDGRDIRLCIWRQFRRRQVRPLLTACAYFSILISAVKLIHMNMNNSGRCNRLQSVGCVPAFPGTGATVTRLTGNWQDPRLRCQWCASVCMIIVGDQCI